MKQLIGTSPAIKEINHLITQIATKGSTVLIRGESGTGKELVANLIHHFSYRRFNSLVKINCAAIPEHLLEAELFGYSEGAFTGAKKGGAVGKFAQAHKGTIFLDEIGDLSFSTQAKLLRVIQEKEIIPIGSESSIKLDVRIIAATNANLEIMVKEGKFRDDLFYRLNVVSIYIPPLRERKEDILPLTTSFITEFNEKFNVSINGIDNKVKHIFLNYDWPGNIRELKNTLEYAYNIVDGNIIKTKHLPKYILANTNTAITSNNYFSQIGQRSLTEIVDDFEKELIQQALIKCTGNKAKAAELLGLSRPGLYKKLQKHGLI
ncbi:regulatory protein, Fis family [Carboxydocella sporoproducens DSM 16521]|uniref:Regulatory protein, Fis family n=2 Tax=Carboxydocella TaxID=178898 RepID=A0A1T4LTD1_9FIRM|nr:MULTISPECIES: sigma 54-interacting transcriptional regulator [Carboxydocella]AVX20601.1 regulatory protein, Fis family [Carboxydocella thermautotrophica]AVX31023.1 regulatory protein, Fis family [Carboxydocella thermautotrophica]GAW27924.1 sigma-54-dependent Fis family transcriptional regulator [Carboxydocella sp. ULO1]SJZ57881.1 regulatory protein, Fis family [Carboxydocella sporoproducens DSM 16521]